jgi:NAD(P)-dependent dehydrogenase (short-subunit alcohol dehydrogenase family)
MKANRLAGKIAIVTGGATGIGEAVSKKFAAEGANVVIVGFPDDPLDEVVEEIKAQGGQAIAFIRMGQTGYSGQLCRGLSHPGGNT